MPGYGEAASIGLDAAEVVAEIVSHSDQLEFVRDLQSGGERAFEILVAEFERPMIRFLYRYLGHYEEAKEVCQDVFIKIFRGLPAFQNNCSLKTWIYRIALNTVLNEKRRWYHRLKDRFLGLDEVSHKCYDSIPDPELSLTMSERCRSVTIALRKLRPEHRSILILRDMEGLSYQEIAESLGIAMGTVKSRLARARQEMKNVCRDLF